MTQRMQTVAYWLWRSIGWGVDMYGMGILAFLGLRIVIGEAWSWIAVLNFAIHVLLLGSLVCLLVRALWRRRALMLLHVLPTVLLIVHYAPMFAARPSMAQAQADGQTLTVMSYNIRSGGERVPLIGDIILRDAPDVVLIQDTRMAMAEELRVLLRAEYPYTYVYHLWYTHLQILSRYPFAETPQGDGNLGYLRARLQVGAQAVSVYNVHLFSPRTRNLSPQFEQRLMQLAGILTHIDAHETGAVLLAGDFNSSEWSAPYALMSGLYTDAYRAQGYGLGLTRDVQEFPIVRIDYLFHNDGLRTLSAKVDEYSYGSDHRPLLVTLALTSEAGVPN
jgi:vancomycin resistance protein VanJ